MKTKAEKRKEMKEFHRKFNKYLVVVISSRPTFDARSYAILFNVTETVNACIGDAQLHW